MLAQPMFTQPRNFGGERFAMLGKRTKPWSLNRAEIGDLAPQVIRLDMRGSCDF